MKPYEAELGAAAPLQIVVPMAGEGSRFADVGFELPKPLIPVDGLPMIVRALADMPEARRLVLVARAEHDRKHQLRARVSEFLPHAEWLFVEGLTAGQAATVKLAEPLLDPALPVLVGACDNSHRYSPAAWSEAAARDVDALVWTYRGDPRVVARPQQFGWVEVNARRVLRVSCKQPISEQLLQDHVVSGCFYFRTAQLMFSAIDTMFARQIRARGEFYLDIVPNLLVEQGKHVEVFEVDRYLGWGTPEELAAWEQLPLEAARVTAR